MQEGKYNKLFIYKEKVSSCVWQWRARILYKHQEQKKVSADHSALGNVRALSKHTHTQCERSRPASSVLSICYSESTHRTSARESILSRVECSRARCIYTYIHTHTHVHSLPRTFPARGCAHYRARDNERDVPCTWERARARHTTDMYIYIYKRQWLSFHSRPEMAIEYRWELS